MIQTTSFWTVIDATTGVYCLTYEFSKSGHSNTFVARMANGELMVVSPGNNMPEAAFEELNALGKVGALVANNGFHHLGQQEWRKRHPTARCFAPSVAILRIKKKNPDVGPFEPMEALAKLAGGNIGVRVVPDTKAGESWIWVKLSHGYVWYTSDVLANMPKVPPFPISLLFSLTKSAPGFRVFGLALKFIVKDKEATLRLMLEDIEAHPPSVIVPAHGLVLSQPGLANETRELIQRAL